MGDVHSGISIHEDLFICAGLWTSWNRTFIFKRHGLLHGLELEALRLERADCAAEALIRLIDHGGQIFEVEIATTLHDASELNRGLEVLRARVVLIKPVLFFSQERQLLFEISHFRVARRLSFKVILSSSDLLAEFRDSGDLGHQIILLIFSSL